MPALSGAALLTFWSFIGLESATVPADSVEKPERNIPRATIWGVLIAAFIYISSTSALMHLVDAETLRQSDAPFSTAISLILGGGSVATIASKLVSIAAVISCLGALNGWILMQGQIPMAAARDKLFPKVFAKQNSKGVPVVGLLISSSLITGLLVWQAGTDLTTQFDILIELATFLAIVPYFFCALAFLKLLLADKQEKRKVLGTVVALLAMLFVLWAMAGQLLYNEDLTMATLGTALIALLVAGALLFFWKRYQADKS